MRSDRCADDGGRAVHDARSRSAAAALLGRFGWLQQSSHVIALWLVRGAEANVKVEVEVGQRAVVRDGETGRGDGSVEVLGSVQHDATRVRHFATRILRAPEDAIHTENTTTTCTITNTQCAAPSKDPHQ